MIKFKTEDKVSGYVHEWNNTTKSYSSKIEFKGIVSHCFDNTDSYLVSTENGDSVLVELRTAFDLMWGID